VKRPGLILVAALLAQFASSCSEPLTVEQLIIAKIHTIEAQLEEGERRRFMNNIAQDFRGQGGRMNHQQLRAFIVLQLTRYQNLNARLLPVTVQEVGENEAIATFSALLTGGSGLIPDDGQLYAFTTHWRKDDGEWLLVAADWKPASVGELIN
jgi:hypothetical protein